MDFLFFLIWTSQSGKSSFLITIYDLYFLYQQCLYYNLEVINQWITIVHFSDTHLGRVILQSIDVYRGSIIPFYSKNGIQTWVLAWAIDWTMKQRLQPLSHNGWIIALFFALAGRGRPPNLSCCWSDLKRHYLYFYQFPLHPPYFISVTPLYIKNFIEYSTIYVTSFSNISFCINCE